MSNWLDTWNEISPLRKLFVAMLLAVVLAQIAAMALVVRGQVLKAESREATEASARVAVMRSAHDTKPRDGILTVGYATAR